MEQHSSLLLVMIKQEAHKILVQLSHWIHDWPVHADFVVFLQAATISKREDGLLEGFPKKALPKWL